MKNFLTVLKFELLNLLKNKTFKISTIILCLMIIIGLTIPTIMESIGKPIFGEDKSISEKDETLKYGILIENNIVDISDLKTSLPDVDIVNVETKAKLNELVLSDDLSAGFIINSPTKYEYIVKNTSMNDGNVSDFETSLLNIYRNKTLSEKGIDFIEVSSVYDTLIESDTTILGKDGMKNFLYTYILIFSLYFIIILYGQLIATSVASEKSNRTMELLVTSTDTNSLIFGKVIAGALAGIIQFSTILIVAFLSYKANINAWDNSLDFIFNIPGNVLLAFSVFGILGYLFYLFIYGALGALVSRTEDISTIATPITIIFMLSFFISMAGLSNPDFFLLKIASFIPLSSFMAMFVRVSMGTVPLLHVIISLVILTSFTILIGIIGSKIYRLGTLMYGNPVKLSQVFKLLKNK